MGAGRTNGGRIGRSVVPLVLPKGEAGRARDQRLDGEEEVTGMGTKDCEPPGTGLAAESFLSARQPSLPWSFSAELPVSSPRAEEIEGDEIKIFF